MYLNFSYEKRNKISHFIKEKVARKLWEKTRLLISLWDSSIREKLLRLIFLEGFWWLPVLFS